MLQAKAMLMQRKTELAARMKLVEQGTLPKLEAVNLETQFKAAEAALAAAEAETRAQRHSRAVVGRRQRRAGRGRAGGVLDAGQGNRADRLDRSDPRGGRGRGAQSARRSRSAMPAEIRLVTGTDGAAARSASSPRPRARARAPTGSTSRFRMPTATIPDGITAEVDDSARAGAGGARAALGADVLVGGRARRAHRRCRQQGCVRAGVGGRRPAGDSCGSAASPTARA